MKLRWKGRTIRELLRDSEIGEERLRHLARYRDQACIRKSEENLVSPRLNRLGLPQRFAGFLHSSEWQQDERAATENPAAN